MRKRFVLGVLLVLVFAGVLFASGAKESTVASTSQELKGQLNIWSPLTQKERATELENLGKAFEKIHPGVKVNISVMPWAGELDKLMASTMAGNPPDLAVVGQGTPQTIAASGALLELSPLVEKMGGADQFLGTSLSVLSSVSDGGVYAIPLYITPVVAYYRDSYLKEAGYDKIPTTWEEYYDMCKAVTNPAENRYGFGIPLGDHHGTKTVWSFLQSNGVSLVNRNSKGEWIVDIDSTDRLAMIETYDYLYKLIRDCSPKGVISYTQANVREMVGTGIIMSRIDTPEIYYNVSKMDPTHMDDVKYFRIPARKTANQYMGWVGFSVPAAGNTKLAQAFLEFCYSDNNMLDFYLSYPHAMFPASKNMFYDAAYIAGLPSELKPLVPDLALDILSHSSSITLANGPFPFAGEVEQRNLLGLPLTKMLIDGISAEKAADMVISELNKLLEQ